MKKYLILFTLCIISNNILFSQLIELDNNNGFKEYKFNSAITDFPEARLGDFSCPPSGYVGFFTSYSTLALNKAGFDYKKMVKDYVLEPNTTIFGCNVVQLMLSTYNNRIIRIIARVKKDKSPLETIRKKFGKETSFYNDDIHHTQSYYWQSKKVEMSIHTTNLSFNRSMHMKIPLNCNDDYYDIHFTSIKLLEEIKQELIKKQNTDSSDF